MSYQRSLHALCGLMAAGLVWGNSATAQEVYLLDDGCYQAEVDGVVGNIDYDDNGYLIIHDGENVLAYAPDECYAIIEAQNQQEAAAPSAVAAVDSGVKSGNTVPYCDELPAGTVQQCQERIELDLGDIKQ